MKVAVLHDRPAAAARADELDNLAQAEAVAKSLRDLGHEAFPVPLEPEPDRLRDALDQVRAERVFNLVESCWGECRLAHVAPAVLETLGRAYTGSNAFSMLVTGDKVRVKEMLRYAGLPTPAWHTARDLDRNSDKSPARVGGRFLLKPVFEHGSVGLDDDCLVSVESGRELADLLAGRQSRTGLECFAEAYVEGREYNLAGLAGKAHVEILPPAEMRFVNFPEGKPRILGYRSKWEEDSFEARATVRGFDFQESDRPLLNKLKGLVLACWALFEFNGYGRVDFRVGADNRPMIIDVNPNPCLAPDAGLAAAARRAGLDHADLVGRILAAS